jgi:hypothetical protein
MFCRIAGQMMVARWHGNASLRSRAALRASLLPALQGAGVRGESAARRSAALLLRGAMAEPVRPNSTRRLALRNAGHARLRQKLWSE